MMKIFEIWQSPGTCMETSVCPAGQGGAQCRALLETEAKLVHVFEAYSELDMMQKYYDFMGFGAYHSEWPDLAVRPFYWLDGLENLRKLKLPLRPLLEIHFMKDGSTRSIITDPMPRISVQDGAVCSVDLWVRKNLGSYSAVPNNEAALIDQAQMLIKNKAPEILLKEARTFLICPLEIAELMQWPVNSISPSNMPSFCANPPSV